MNRRLGHKPSSREIDKYVNWLALDRHVPKRKLHDNEVARLTRQVEELQDREKFLRQRQRTVQDEVARLQEQLETNNRRMFTEVRRMLAQIELPLSNGAVRPSFPSVGPIGDSDLDVTLRAIGVAVGQVDG